MRPIAFARFKYTPYGGAENYLGRLLGALDERGADYRVLSTNWGGDKSEKIFVPHALPSFMRMLRFAFAVCQKKRADEILFSLERTPCADIYRAGDGVHRAWVEARILRGESKLKIFSNPLQFTYLWLEKQTFANASLIVANSYFVKNDIVRYYGIPEQKIKVVYNGVPKNDIDADSARHALAEEFGIKEDEKIILFVGSGFGRKGVAEFLRILSKLRNIGFRALIVGKEKRIGHFRQVAKKFGVEAIFTGPRSDVQTFYAGADVFLFPTHYEPFSNVCLEAMAGGCAVVTTAQNGAAEVLDAEFVIKNPYDEEAVKILDMLLVDEDYLRLVKAKNKESAAKFSVEKNMEETLALLERV